MPITRLTIAVTLLLLQLAIYAGTVRWIRRNYPGKRPPIIATRILFLFFNTISVVVVLARPSLSHLPPWMMTLGVHPYYLWYGSTLVLGLVLLVSWLMTAPFRLLHLAGRRIPPVQRQVQRITATRGFERFNRSRRVFLKHGALGLAGTAVGATAYGMYLERTSFDERDETFFLRNLHPGLEGFTIGLVTDIHSSVNMTRDDMDEIVRRLNALSCDLVVVGGDFVNGQAEEVTPFAEAFCNLRAPHGVYGVTGNHDYYTEDTAAVLREVRACGITLLQNDNVLVSRNGGSFSLVGVNDPGRGGSFVPPIPGAMARAPRDVPRILLCHRPYPFPSAASHGADLMLSGHTHGGQVVFGRIGNVVITPATLASLFVWGRYSLGDSQMYVSRGVGTVGIPVRLNCSPEITRITLRARPLPV